MRVPNLPLNQINWVEICKGDEDVAIVSTPFGRLSFQSRGDSLTGIKWVSEDSAILQPETFFLDDLLNMLQQYWTHPEMLIPVPVLRRGTEFQRKVWAGLCRIPFSETRTYGDIGKLVGTSPRAVGGACRNNPYPVIIPCHRVVSASGLGGYAGQLDGDLLNIKRQLLASEASFSR